MKAIDTIFYDKETKLEHSPDALLVFVQRLEAMEVSEAVTAIQPRAVVHGFNTSNAAVISAAAERTRAMLYPRVGVIYPSPSEDPGFFAWAVMSKYSPIVLLPARRNAQRRLLDLQSMGYLENPTWVHLAGEHNVTEATFPKVHFTTGEDW